MLLQITFYFIKTGVKKASWIFPVSPTLCFCCYSFACFEYRVCCSINITAPHVIQLLTFMVYIGSATFDINRFTQNINFT